MSACEDLRIEAYRGLCEVRLEQLGQVNLLVGPNNAGKTSVLEALGLVARPFDPGQWVQTATNRDATGPLVDGLWSLFPSSRALTLEGGHDASNPLSITARFGDAERHVRAQAVAFTEAWSPERIGAEVQTEAAVRIRVDAALNKGAPRTREMEFHGKYRRLPVDPSDVPPLRAFVVTPVTHRSTTQLIAQLSHVIDQGAKDQCIQVLRLFDPRVKDVMISRPFGRDAIRVEHEHGIVDLATFGDGMRRAFAMSVALVRASGGLLLIDEIESAIHARALDVVLPWLVRSARELDVQIVATTHSIEAVDAVLEAFGEADPETVITYHLRRTEAGHDCRRLDLPELRDLRAEGLDIR